MSGYIGPIPVPQGIQNKETFTATAGQTTFNTNGYTDGAFISVYLNGVRLINGTDYTATNGSDVVLASAAAASDVVDFETFNSFSLASQQFENITTKNPTHEDTDGGRESAISFQGEQSGGEISTLAAIQASHDGTADDQKGDLIFKTNDGSDNNAPTEAMRIDSSQNVGINIAAPSNDLHILGKDTDTSTGITIQTDDTANAIASLTLMSRNASNVNKTATIKNNAGALALDSQLDVSYAGGGDFVAKFQNTTDATPYGVHVKDASSGANGYPLLQVTSGDGSDTYFRVDSGTGITTKPTQPAFQVNKGSNTQANFAVGSDVLVTFGTERFDVGSNFASNTFTAPVTGKYVFSILLRVDSLDIDSNYYIPFIETSNHRYRFIVDPNFSSDPAYYSFTLTVLADMDANDTCVIKINQGTGAAASDISGDPDYTWWTGYLAC